MSVRAVEVESPSSQMVRWFVLRTKSRQEKALASSLAQMRTDHYLPLVKSVRYYGRRKAVVDLPLFPGYMFLFGTPDEAYVADRTGRVAQILQVTDQKQLEWELANIRLAIGRDAPLLPWSYIDEGIRVEVRAGPFRGLQGVVHQKKSNDRLVLQVDAFGGAVSLEVDGSLLERVD